MRGATLGAELHHLFVGISIHAPHAGRDEGYRKLLVYDT